MLLVVPNATLPRWLDKFFKGFTGNPDWRLRLYQNDYTPVPATVTGDFTEATFTGYTPRIMVPIGWNDSVLVGNMAVITWGQTQPLWTCGAVGNTIYGFYVTWFMDDQIALAQRFDTPRVLTDGKILAIDPKLHLYTAPA